VRTRNLIKNGLLKRRQFVSLERNIRKTLGGGLASTIGAIPAPEPLQHLLRFSRADGVTSVFRRSLMSSTQARHPCPRRT
jgi:hypothetical protein